MKVLRPSMASLVSLALAVLLATTVRASDHLDSPSTVANPQADIGDVYAWMSTDGRRLNLALTIQGHTFSDKLLYAIHVDSGSAFGQTTASSSISCRFSAATAVNCNLDDTDSVAGDPTGPVGIHGRAHRLRVYAGLRDDPFYNNVKGLLAAYQVASGAVKNGAAVDAAGCAHFDEPTARLILDRMSHTDGGPAQNLLHNWSVSAIVVSVDLEAVAKGGKLLAVWGSTSAGDKRIDRMGRPFVANTLLGVAPFSTDDASGQRRQQYNEASSGNATQFVPDLEKALAFQDSLDGNCGNQVLAQPQDVAARYEALASVFADDRLWVDSSSHLCTQFFAVELANVAGRKSAATDCGGRAPTYDAPNTWRSLLIAGTPSGVSDGLHQDEHPPSATEFPFLAPPDSQRVDH